MSIFVGMKMQFSIISYCFEKYLIAGISIFDYKIISRFVKNNIASSCIISQVRISLIVKLNIASSKRNCQSNHGVNLPWAVLNAFVGLPHAGDRRLVKGERCVFFRKAVGFSSLSRPYRIKTGL